MSRTPWTKPTSSFPSDRIKPKPSPNPTQSKNKGKGNQQRDDEPPKSKPVRKLEKLLSGIRKSKLDERDPKGGCFCLARTHELSPYTPLCRSCGLILCSLNAPYYACPHCTEPLITASSSPSTSRSISRDALVAQIEAELESTLAAEQAAREREIEQARIEAGAFPMLRGGNGSGTASPSPAANRMAAASAPPSRQSQPQSQTHKVMSLTSKPGNARGRVVVSSYTTVTTPVPSRPSSRNANVDDLEEGIAPRVPAPIPLSKEVAPPPTKERPWLNYVHGPVTYKPPLRVDDERGTVAGTSSSKRRRGKAKVKNDDGGSAAKG
ncbi:hypothetical protein JR316_0008553 [Psilocybe cubensis]|uniref:TRIP4/RQT4 C2HC5-type zinc finger domain-containing protein n=2 Tax=Psilocybe cubensis TaxID=181762 RepID=A0A8H8CEF6_PSICU|nr:hypothetical protein JR316_0008553 [Psilocybe cubensis]KAH9479956.1 hypothetical protein JR316_0008553 [Psilocybe cubensis]